MDIRPNNDPLPSEPWNDPMTSPFYGFNAQSPLDFSNVPEQVAVNAEGRQLLTPQGPINDLMALRSRYPFLPILPFPAIIKPLFLTANTAVDLPVPTGAALLLLNSNLDFYISRNGQAAIPTAANTSQALGDNVNQSFISPKGYLWYIGGMNQFSLIAPADTIVSAIWFVPEQYPRV